MINVPKGWSRRGRLYQTKYKKAIVSYTSGLLRRNGIYPRSLITQSNLKNQPYPEKQ